MLHVALFRQRALLIALLAFGVVLVLWNVRGFDALLYPLRLFVTFVHETGHGLAAIASGGRFIGFQVFENGAGIATTAGGARWLILPAGYLGAAAFGAGLFFIANRSPFTKTITLCVAIFLGVVTVFYTDLGTLAFFVGAGMTLALLIVWRWGDRGVNLLVLDVLAMVVALNAVLDLLTLIQNPGGRLGTIRNDAAAFSAEVMPLLPPVVIALSWAAIAIGLLTLAVWYGIIRQR